MGIENQKFEAASSADASSLAAAVLGGVISRWLGDILTAPADEPAASVEETSDDRVEKLGDFIVREFRDRLRIGVIEATPVETAIRILAELKAETASLQSLSGQVAELADWIIANHPHALKGDGAIGTALELMKTWQKYGVPNIYASDAHIAPEITVSPFASPTLAEGVATEPMRKAIDEAISAVQGATNGYNCATPALTFSDLILTSGHHWRDISNEDGRSYIYDEGLEFDIDKPLALAVSENGGHRVVNAHGESFYVKPGWRVVQFDAKLGAPHFSF